MTVSAEESLTVDEGRLLEWYEQMAIIRQTEKAAYDLFMSGLVKGTTHLAAGHEAVAVGASAALRPDDYVFATYRGHHHAIARGATPAECLAELMSRATGLCKAKGGSMHLTKADRGMLGSYAIVGSHLPIAAGAAWSAKLRGTDQVAVAFFGDGATNIGAFHEALNLAAVWKLPVLFVCENNLYMEYTPISAVTSVANPAADRASAYGLPAMIIDGNDVIKVYEATKIAVERARAAEGPTVIEALTYRHYGHSRSDPAKYRPADEVERWMQRDPLLVARQRLTSLGVDADDIDTTDDRVARVINAAVREAKDAPFPDPVTAFTDVGGDGGSACRKLITYRQALSDGLAGALRRDSTVVFLGEDLGAAEGGFKTTPGLFAEFGPERVWDTPISEQAIVGAAWAPP